MLGTLNQVRSTLADFNTSPDGGPTKSMGTDFLYGPGFTLEIATSADPVMQAIISVSDDDLALPCLMRLCKTKGWKLMDLESGRTFGG